MTIWHPRPLIGVDNDDASSFGAVPCLILYVLSPRSLGSSLYMSVDCMNDWMEGRNECMPFRLKKEWPAKNYQLSPSSKGIAYAGHSPDATWSCSCACWADVELWPVVAVSLPRTCWQTRAFCGAFEVCDQLASLVTGIWSLPRTVSEVNLFLWNIWELTMCQALFWAFLSQLSI